MRSFLFLFASVHVLCGEALQIHIVDGSAPPQLDRVEAPRKAESRQDEDENNQVEVRQHGDAETRQDGFDFGNSWSHRDGLHRAAREARPFALNITMIRLVERHLVWLEQKPFLPVFSFDILRPGVIQHTNRAYTYDVVPPELENSILFQGLHPMRPPFEMKLQFVVPATAYLFFHPSVDGGWRKLLEAGGAHGWTRVTDTFAPKYDINATGQAKGHGENMVMYKLSGSPKKEEALPPLESNCVFSLAFQPHDQVGFWKSMHEDQTPMFPSSTFLMSKTDELPFVQVRRKWAAKGATNLGALQHRVEDKGII